MSFMVYKIYSSLPLQLLKKEDSLKWIKYDIRSLAFEANHLHACWVECSAVLPSGIEKPFYLLMSTEPLLQNLGEVLPFTKYS